MGHRSLQQAVERQSGAARALAIAIEGHVATLAPWEARVIEPFAEIAREIADGLTAALADDDRKLRKLWRYAGTFALSLAVGAAGGSAEGTFGQLMDSPKISECAASMADANAEDWPLLDRKPRRLTEQRKEELARNRAEARAVRAYLEALPEAGTGSNAAEDLDRLESEFVRVAKGYADRKGITYAAFRTIGVPAATLKRAQVGRTT